MIKIAGLIRNGGLSCLNAQYQIVFLLAPALFGLFYYLKQIDLAFGLAAGTISCLACVYYCFTIAMCANIRTANSAMTSLKNGFRVSYGFGKSVGTFVLAASMLLAAAFFFYPAETRFKFMLGSGIGVSMVGIFARLAGGIFTKGADIGADLVGKVMKDMPEDDPRNPGTIADNIGDNIGDCVGTAADVHETYVLAMFAIAYFTEFTTFMVPMVAATIGALVGINLIKNPRIKDSEDEIASTIFGMIQLSLGCAVVAYFGLQLALNAFSGVVLLSFNLAQVVPFLMGILCVGIILLLVQYYTSKSNYPVKFLAKSCRDGASMNIIGGYALSLQAAFSLLFIMTLFGFASYQIYGLNGLIALIVTMLGFVSAVMTMDTYGPVTDNAGGIVSMSGAPEQARKNTDALDAVGNLTKALTKGYSSGITIFTAFLLLKLYTSKSDAILNISMQINNPAFIFGSFIGATIPFLFSGLVIRSVHKAANYMLHMIQKIAGSMTPEDKEYYTRPIQSLSAKSVRSMILPILAIALPIATYVLFYYGSLGLGNPLDANFKYYYLSGTLLGTTITGLLLSVCMTIGGATWDNTKKLVEQEIGEEIEEKRNELDNLVDGISQTQRHNQDSSNFDFNGVHNIASSLEDLVKLEVKDSDKSLVFDTFSKAVSKQIESLKEWTNEAKNYIGNVNLDQHGEPVNIKACLNAVKNGTAEGQSTMEEVFALYGHIESLKRIKDASVVGDTLGDPLKDAAGTGLNSMVKMSLIIGLASLVFLKI